MKTSTKASIVSFAGFFVLIVLAMLASNSVPAGDDSYQRQQQAAQEDQRRRAAQQAAQEEQRRRAAQQAAENERQRREAGARINPVQRVDRIEVPRVEQEKRFEPARVFDRANQDRIAVERANQVRAADRANQNRITVERANQVRAADRANQDRIAVERANQVRAADRANQDRIAVERANQTRVDDPMVDPDDRELLSGSRQAEDEVPAHSEEIDHLTARFGNDRFDDSVSEEELVELAHELFPNYPHDPAVRGKVVLHQGRVRPGLGRPKDSTVPDLYLPGARRRPPISLDAKNYFVGEEGAYDQFIIDTVVQARKRVAGLPRSAQQHVLIDLRGQDVTREFADALRRDLAARSGGILRPDRIYFLPRSLD